MKLCERTRTAIVLLAFAVLFTGLSVGSYMQTSATVDEPQHVVAGYTMWKLHDYRVDPEHPPFLRLWAALPLLAMPNITLATTSPHWRAGDQWRFCHDFLFQDNDANRLLVRARLMVTLLGILLGVLVFCWSRELFGFWPAVVTLGFLCTEPNLLAHAGLVTTDLGATTLIFGAVYFAWRLARHFSRGNLLGLTVFFVLAQLSKYSAVLLVPVVSAILAGQALTVSPWLQALGRPRLITGIGPKSLWSLAVIAGLLAAAYFALWASYGFRYAPTTAGVEQAQFFARAEASQRLPHLTRLLQWIDEHHLLPNACAQGLVSMAAKAEARPAYLLGESSTRGWWYYFPLAFLIKTSLALLALALVGLVLCVSRWRAAPLDVLAVLTPILVYFGAAVAGHLNIGLRHILPVYPFVLLLAGGAIAALLARPAAARLGWRVAVLGALCLGQLTEFSLNYPNSLAFFNVTVGGSRHGADYLVDSNLDWGQDLKRLHRWMTDHHVAHINLSYFGTADPRYYKIEYTPLPGAPFFDQARIAPPRLPGYVAVSATNLRGAYVSDFARSLFAPLQQRRPNALIGYSIYVYWVERPWWEDTPP